jgi:hypothetical protein
VTVVADEPALHPDQHQRAAHLDRLVAWSPGTPRVGPAEHQRGGSGGSQVAALHQMLQDAVRGPLRCEHGCV